MRAAQHAHLRSYPTFTLMTSASRASSWCRELAAAVMPATLRRCSPTRADSRDRPLDSRLRPRALLLLCEGRLVLAFLRSTTQRGREDELVERRRRRQGASAAGGDQGAPAIVR